MVQGVDYYTLLARAVQSLERDAYAARGVVYDREHKALLKRLISSKAFCNAIRKNCSVVGGRRISASKSSRPGFSRTSAG